MKMRDELETAVCDLDDREWTWRGESTTDCERECERDESVNVCETL